MKAFYYKNYALIIAVFLLVAFLFVTPVIFGSVLRVHAQATSNTAQQTAINEALNSRLGIVGTVLEAVLLFSSSIVGFMIPVAAFLFGLAVQINMDLLQPSANVAVSVGWDIFRVITNLGFVLGIIVIAIGTIMRSNSYRAQQILWKLIVAALLVNFSLVIAGAILNLSDSLSKYFINSFRWGQQYHSEQYSADTLKTGGPSIVDNNSNNNQLINNIIGDIVDYTGSANIQSPDKDSGTSSGYFQALAGARIFGGLSFNDIIGPTIGILFSLMLQIVLYVIIFLTILSLAFMVFIRYFYITLLLIISPIVWLMWVFPFGRRWWYEWWNHFVKWTFMLPLNLFFLWLALQMNIGVKQVMSQMADNLAHSSYNGGTIFSGLISLSSVVGSIVAISFIILGMKLSHKLGISAAEGGIKTAQNAGKFVKEKGIEYGRRGAGAGAAAVGRKVGVENIGTRISAWAGARKGAVTGFIARETVGRAGKGLIMAGAAAQKRAGEPIFGKPPEEFVKEYSQAQWTPDRLIAAYAGVPREEQLAILMALESKKKLNVGNIKKLGGEEELFAQAEYLQKSGRNATADSIYVAMDDNRATFEARKGLDAIREQLRERNEVQSEKVAFEGEKIGLEERLKELQKEIEAAKNEVKSAEEEVKSAEEERNKARDRRDLKAGVEAEEIVRSKIKELDSKTKNLDSKNKELDDIKSKMSSAESQISSLEGRLAPLDVAVKPKEEELRKAREKFNSDYKKPEEQKRIGAAIFSEGDENKLTEGQKLDRIIQAEFINKDPSGNRLYGIIPSMDTDDKLKGMMRALILAATKQTQLSGSLKESFDRTFDGGGSVSDLMSEMRRVGARDEGLLKRLEKQINRSVGGDLGFSDSGSKEEKKSAPEEGGGGNKGKSEGKK